MMPVMAELMQPEASDVCIRRKMRIDELPHRADREPQFFDIATASLHSSSKRSRGIRKTMLTQIISMSSCGLFYAFHEDDACVDVFYCSRWSHEPCLGIYMTRLVVYSDQAIDLDRP
jgi:hypothetical protein